MIEITYVLVIINSKINLNNNNPTDIMHRRLGDYAR